MKAPEVFVVVELGLGGAAKSKIKTGFVYCTSVAASPSELSSKHPELATSLTDHTGLVGGARGRTPGGDHPGPLRPLG